jgi:hypothetical protein
VHIAHVKPRNSFFQGRLLEVVDYLTFAGGRTGQEQDQLEAIRLVHWVPLNPIIFGLGTIIISVTGSLAMRFREELAGRSGSILALERRTMTRIRIAGMVVLMGLLVLPACGQGAGQSTEDLGVENRTPSIFANESATNPSDETPTNEPTIVAVTPTPAANPLKPEYTLQASYDDIHKTLAVEEQVSFVNPAQKSLDELSFVVEPNMFTNGFELAKISVAGEEYTSGVELNDNQLNLNLNQPLEVGAEVQVDLRFSLLLPAVPPPSDTEKPQVYGYTDRQTNLVDWFVLVPPYDSDSGWLIHPPSYFGEYLVYPEAGFDVTLRVSDYAQPLVVAASVLGEQDGDSYHYSLANGRNFVFSFSSEYLVSQNRVGSVTITTYTFPYDKNAGAQVLNDVSQAYDIYSRVYGPLDQKSLSVVEADYLDGMEFQGLVFLSKGFYNLYDGTEKGYLSMIAVHETSHQWWYASVANDQAIEPWLDEALATYSEEVYYENTQPELVDWWWAYRVNFYQPSGAIDLPVYSYNGFTAYRNAVYLDGALFLEQVRQIMGDEAFFASLKEYHQAYAQKIAKGSDLLRIFEKNSTQDLTPAISAYFQTR